MILGWLFHWLLDSTKNDDEGSLDKIKTNFGDSDKF